MRSFLPCAAIAASALALSADGADAFVPPVVRPAVLSSASRELPSPRPPRASPPKSAAVVAVVAVAAKPAALAADHHRSSSSYVAAGKIFPFLSNFLLTPAKIRRIGSALTDIRIDPFEFVLMAAVGWGLVPAMRFLRERKLELERGDGGDEGAIKDGDDDEDDKPFEETHTYLAVELAGEASKIGCAVYIVDCLSLALSASGFQFMQRRALSGYFARIAYATWFTIKVRDFKHSLLEKYALKKSRHREGKIKVYDRLINAVLFFAAGMGILDILNFNMGRAAASLLSLGGIGTLVFSLASKDLAEQLVSGLSVSTSDRFYEGDEIRLGDGTVGVVTKIGWTHTEMRNSDQTTTSIPNSKIFNQRVTNMSRVYKSQVKQTLWFSYDDLDKMDDVCEAIVGEIRKSCGKELVRSRDPRAHWREYASDHLEVVVDAHFNVPPVGARYLDNKQRVLNAIGRAVRGCGVDFSLPTQMEIQKGGCGEEQVGRVVE